MKKFLISFISLLLVLTLAACGGSGSDAEGLSAENLQKKINEVLDSDKLNAVEKGLKILPFMVDKGTEWDYSNEKIKVLDDYQGFLDAGADYIDDILSYTGLSDSERKEFTDKLADMIKGNISSKKVALYGNVFVKTIKGVPGKPVLSNPDLNIGKWSDTDISEAQTNAKAYGDLYKKFVGNPDLLDNFVDITIDRDPVGLMVMYVNNKEAFPNSLLKKLGDNPLKVLSYAEFFSGKNKDDFFSCFPKEGDTGMALHFLNLKLNEKTKGNLDVYGKLYPQAASIARMDFSADFQKVLDEYTGYCQSHGIVASKEELYKTFSGINYSGIALKDLLTTPLDPQNNTYVLAVTKSGSKTTNDQSENYKIVKDYITSNSDYKEAPLEYARYVITVSWKHSKTRRSYKIRGIKMKYVRMYKLSGTLKIYDRLDGTQKAKIGFSTPTKISSATRFFCDDASSCKEALMPYCKPTLEKAKSDFYVKLKGALNKLN